MRRKYEHYSKQTEIVRNETKEGKKVWKNLEDSSEQVYD